ncbi:CHAT domain-containing tetratricopeptide repeat protein [Nonomuraea sp. NPDC046570]|uniref:CHAT domain-containing protein n=1 Tax=Nonomuraea sp. NPDC046570 TaxID=3155255 RepID=UPI0033F72F93
MTDVAWKELVGAAEAAVLSSGIDPGHALASAREVLAAAERMEAVEPAVIALRAMALASRELGDLQNAECHLRRAIATTGAPAERLAQARLSLVTVRTERGHPLQALRVAALAWSYLSPLDRAKLDTQRAVALAHLGRHQEAIACCDRALAVLADAPGTVDDLRFLAGGLLNRGLVHAYRGRWDAATRDIGGCLDVAQRAGLAHLARLAAANLPFLAVRQGDIPRAFAHYRASEDTLFGFPERLATMRADFAGALLAAHLPGEARALLRLAIPDLEASGARVALAEARLKLAQVELLAGDARQAVSVAEQAKAELASQDRASWVPLAAEVVLRARLVLEPARAELLAEFLACVRELEDHGHHAGSAALRLAAAEVALTLGDEDAALAELDRINANEPAEPGPGAAPAPEPEPAPDSGEGVSGRHLAFAYGAGGGSLVLTRLASRQQAAYLQPGARDDGVPAVVSRHAAALQAALRGDTAAAYRAVLDGLANVGARAGTLEDPSHKAHAVRAGERLADLGLDLAVKGGEPEEVFAWAERWRAVAATGAPAAPSLDAVRTALAGTVLIEFIRHGDDLLAVLISRDRVLLRRLCAATTAAEAVMMLRYGLRRAILGDCATLSRPHEPTPVTAEGAQLEELLLGPFKAELAGHPLVVVPTGALHTLPWSALPSLHARPVSVAPSTAAWLAAQSPEPAVQAVAGSRGGPLVVAAAGPGLEYAEAEVERVLRCHGRAERVAARTGEVLDALDRADVLHLATHGVFHSRSPLLSAITLDDGPLMAYDLLTLRRPPRLVVLSACDSGMAHVPAEGAPLGLAGTFLARGVACVVAGLVPVDDEEAVKVMTLFHELLAGGASPAAALATATARTGTLGFACFGAGNQPLARPATGQPVSPWRPGGSGR